MRQFWKIWWIALAVKTVLAILLPLSNDEAYYWVWGHNPQLSYFDHPPMVGWLFSIGTLFENLGNAARLPGVWLGHLTLLIWSEILRPYLDEKRLNLWLIFILLSPFFGIGSLIITPDVPFVFFWSLSLYLLLKLIEKPTLPLYAAFGASLGVGFCSKYLIVLFVPAALLWICFFGAWRKVRLAYIPVTIIAGLLFCFPVLYWNYQHEWASFNFQINHGLGGKKWSPWWPLEYLGGQFLILFPIVAWYAFRRREPKGTSFLHFFGWFPFAFFFYSSFKAHVEANWPIMAHLSILSLAFLNVKDFKWIKVTMGVWVVALIIVISEVTFKWLPIDEKKLKTNEIGRFDVIAEAIKDETEVYLGSYQMAASVSYKLRRQIYKLNGLNRKDFYDFSPHSQPTGDRFILACDIDKPLPQWVAEKGYVVASSKRLSDEFHILEVTRAQGAGR